MVAWVFPPIKKKHINEYWDEEKSLKYPEWNMQYSNNSASINWCSHLQKKKKKESYDSICSLNRCVLKVVSVIKNKHQPCKIKIQFLWKEYVLSIVFALLKVLNASVSSFSSGEYFVLLRHKQNKHFWVTQFGANRGNKFALTKLRNKY